MDVHFLQSEPWAHFQESLGKQTFTEVGDGWHFMVIVESSAGIKRLYCPYGPLVTSDDALQAALASLTRLGNKIGATFLRIQPVGLTFSRENIANYHAQPIAYTQPSHTWCLDLSQSEDELYAAMKQNTRNICRNYPKKGLTYRQSHDPSDISHLNRLLATTASHNHITVHDAAYLAQQAISLLADDAASIHLIEYQNESIAAALVYEGEATHYYAHAASSFANRNLGAATALLGEIIFDAKAKGKQVMDLYGIAPTDDPTHRWAGFTKFKKSFGGYPVTYNQTYDIPLKHTSYLLYKVLKHLR